MTRVDYYTNKCCRSKLRPIAKMCDKNKERESQNRTKSAPPHILAGRRLLSTRQLRNSSNRRTLGKRGASRAKSRGAYERSYTSASPTKARQPLVSTSIVRTPGYTLTRTPTNVRMDINTTAFFGGRNETEDVEPSRSTTSRLSKPSVASKRNSPSASTVMHIAMLEQANQEKQALQVEVAELNIAIKNMKTEYLEGQNEKEVDFVRVTDEIKKKHLNEMDQLEEKHQQEICTMQDYHYELMKTITKEHEDERDQYRERLANADEQLRESSRDKDQALKDMEAELKQLHFVELQKLENKLSEEANARVEQAQAKLKAEYGGEIEEIMADHQREIDGMVKKYNEATALKEDLQKSLKKNKKLEKEISRLKEKLKAAKDKQIQTEALLQVTTKKLEELQGNFKEKVWQVESNFRDRIDGMMSENALLRRRLLQKTDQFSDYRNHTEMLQAQGIRSIREKVQIVLRARQKASMSIAMTTTEIDPPQHERSRPSSAPATKLERNYAKQKTS